MTAPERGKEFDAPMRSAGEGGVQHPARQRPITRRASGKECRVKEKDKDKVEEDIRAVIIWAQYITA